MRCLSPSIRLLMMLSASVATAAVPAAGAGAPPPNTALRAAPELETAQLETAGLEAAGQGTEPVAEGRDDRIARIGFRLVSANAGLCARQARPAGLRLHTLGSYAAQDRQAIRLATGLGDGFGVLGVVPGSPAADAGLRPGDEIIGIGQIDATAFRRDTDQTTASHDRVTAFLDLVDREAASGTVALRWLHDGREQHAALSIPPGCAARFVVIADGKADAWTDGRHVAITAALADLLDDGELAFALGHELAHVVLGHAERRPGALAAIGVGAGRMRDEEQAADAMGVRLAARAGFAPAAAERFLHKLAAVRDTDHSLTHPSSTRRIAGVRAAATTLADAPQP